MNPRRLVLVLGVAGLIGVAAWLALRPAAGEDRLSGYVEGETLYLAAGTAGPVKSLAVSRGDRVAAGAPLFEIDVGPLSAARAQAEAGAAAAQAQARDARLGQRPQELAMVEAQQAAARAAYDEARAAHARVRSLFQQGVYAQARLDAADAALRTAAARLEEADRRLAVARLGARSEQAAAAQARAVQAGEAVVEAERRIDQTAPRAPASGRVEDVYFQPGEWAPANQPVIALLPDDAVFVRFFVPAGEVARYRPGKAVRFACDACPEGLTATISYVSPRPEFTPPVIYSRDSRERLVFLVEARPASPRSLTPGLPVDVERLAPEGGK
jgi:HlyD family secretion protein